MLHTHINRHFGIATVHSKMCNSFPDDMTQADAEMKDTIDSIRQALTGTPMRYSASPESSNRTGAASGVLIGGNLSMIQSVSGTDSEIDTSGKILFLEDVGEYFYSIDRMMIHLKRAGKFDKLHGLILGGFTDTKDTDLPYGKTVDEILYEQVKDFDFPVCFHFPVSHEAENYALKIGGNYTLTVNKESVTLEERQVE